MAGDLDKLPGLKEERLVKMGNCKVCGEPALKGGPTFYCVSILHGGFMLDAIKRRVGLEMQLGSSKLAQVMGPNEDIAKIVDGPREVFVHEGCASGVYHLAMLLETERAKEPA